MKWRSKITEIRNENWNKGGSQEVGFGPILIGKILKDFKIDPNFGKIIGFRSNFSSSEKLTWIEDLQGLKEWEFQNIIEFELANQTHLPLTFRGAPAHMCVTITCTGALFGGYVVPPSYIAHDKSRALFLGGAAPSPLAGLHPLSIR